VFRSFPLCSSHETEDWRPLLEWWQRTSTEQPTQPLFYGRPLAL